MPYEVTENYTAQEPYKEFEAYYEEQSYEVAESHRSMGYSPEGYYVVQCAAGCTCTHWNYDPEVIPSHYCDGCSCPESRVVTKTKSVPKYRTVTKYKDVIKTHNVTKIRIEQQPAEVNWIFGYKTPYSFHLPQI